MWHDRIGRFDLLIANHRKLVCPTAAALLGTMILLLCATALAVPPSVYHSPMDDGAAPGAVPNLPPNVPATLHLYIDGGSTPSSEPCLAGLGEEVCAWDLIIEGRDGVNVMSFTGAGDVVFNLLGNVLRFNGGNVNGGTLGPAKLGDVVIQGPDGGSVRLLTSTSVNSMMGGDTLEEVTLSEVPEPGSVIGLIAGVGMLGFGCLRRQAHNSKLTRSTHS